MAKFRQQEIAKINVAHKHGSFCGRRHLHMGRAHFNPNSSTAPLSIGIQNSDWHEAIGHRDAKLGAGKSGLM
jgi:hypothetical protein